MGDKELKLKAKVKLIYVHINKFYYTFHLAKILSLAT
jgi:hypothetical protein